ncbi:MAG: 1-acyl-sn-glycerol-3-phosphate acyltransferase [Flavobacteriaceae bacterium]|nr:1-acyl-sn-glycerol-3-phosphate acyltransferase [Flavobacteriaceae bacterium]
MKRIIANLILFISRWKVDYPTQFMIDKCVMIAAPHTSNWDLMYAVAVYWKKGIKAKFLIKDSYTKGKLGFIFTWLGALGIDRSKHTNFVDYAADLLKSSDKLVLLVPAEGTRKWVKKWKTGFYHIDSQAEVPVALGFLDYKNKVAGVGGLYYLTDNFNVDMDIIQTFYLSKTAKHPKQYNKTIY